jgi:hypothetical protein
MTCSGAWATTHPCRRSPSGRRARRSGESPRAVSCAVFSPSYLLSWVKSTVRIGMFTPTPSGVRAAHHLEHPAWASFSQSSRYFGSSPAWCRPIPWESSRRMSLPNGESNRASVSAARSALLLVAGGDVGGGERLGLLGRGALGEVDQVDRRPAALHQLLERLVQRRLPVLVLERDGALSAPDRGHLATGEVPDALLDGSGVPQRRGHQEEGARGKVRSGICQAAPRSRSP